MKEVDAPYYCPECAVLFYVTSDGVLAEVAIGQEVFATIDGEYYCPYCDSALRKVPAFEDDLRTLD